MSCEQFEDSYDLYALGTLEETEAESLRDHLSGGCNRCRSEVNAALQRAAVITSAVPLVDPPARLRVRIRQSIDPKPERASSFWGWRAAIAAMCLASVAAVFVAYRATTARQQLSAESERVSKMLEILGAPGTVEVPLSDTSERKLAGTLYVHKKLGMAMVVNQLPPLPGGWTYEAWMVPKGGAPQPVEAFKADEQGRAVSVITGPVEISTVAAMAVSMEPEGSRPVKPTKVIFTSGV